MCGQTATICMSVMKSLDGMTSLNFALSVRTDVRAPPTARRPNLTLRQASP